MCRWHDNKRLKRRSTWKKLWPENATRRWPWPKASGSYSRNHYVWLIFPSCLCQPAWESPSKGSSIELWNKGRNSWRKLPFYGKRKPTSAALALRIIRRSRFKEKLATHSGGLNLTLKATRSPGRQRNSQYGTSALPCRGPFSKAARENANWKSPDLSVRRHDLTSTIPATRRSRRCGDSSPTPSWPYAGWMWLRHSLTPPRNSINKRSKLTKMVSAASLMFWRR